MTTPEPLVYLVDDEPAVLRSVARVLRAAGFCTMTFDSPKRFLEEHDPSAPGCVVMDLVMPGIDGLALQRALAEAGEQGVRRSVIFLTGHADVPKTVAAMKHGAVDFLTKPVDKEVLVATVRRALELDIGERRELAGAVELKSRLETLTPREREVMAHVVAGELNKQVAAAMGTTEGTIKVHRGRVMRKMAAGSLAELVRMADRVGIK